MEEQKESFTSTSQGGGGRGNGDVEEIVNDELERNKIERASLNEDLALSNDLVVVVSDDKHANDA